MKVPSVLILLLSPFSFSLFFSVTLSLILLSLSRSLYLSFCPSFLVPHHRIRLERVVLRCERVSIERSSEFASCFIAFVPSTLQQAVSGRAYPGIKQFIRVKVASICKMSLCLSRGEGDSCKIILPIVINHEKWIDL